MIDPHDIVLFRLREGQTITKQLPPGYLNAEDLAKLRRFYDPSGAEIFFAKCVLVVEGDSERAALPEMARKLAVDPANPQFGQMDLDLSGISVISVDGKDNFRNFLKPLTAEAFDIPWVLLCDDDALDVVASQLRSLGVIDPAEWKGTASKDDVKAILRRANAICLAGDFEDSYLAAVPEQEVLTIIDTVDGAGAVQRYVQQRSASDSTYTAQPSTSHIHDYVKHRGKPYLARRIAESIAAGSLPPEIERVLRLATAMAG
jgi:predicted ATP-dependent endonuclease of OLD family